MKRVCVLLPGAIANDGRVIRTIRTMRSSGAAVDLFFEGVEGDGEGLFDESVRLFPVSRSMSFPAKLRRNTLFYRDWLLLSDRAIREGASYDVIWADDLPALLPGHRLRAARGGLLVYDSHEIFLETLNQCVPMDAPGPRGVVFRMLYRIMRRTGRRAERRLCRGADRFVTVSRSLAEHFAAEYGIEEPAVMMNCPVLAGSPPAPAVDFRAEYGWAERDRVFLYQGIQNLGRGLPTLLGALAATDPRAKLVLVGDGPLHEQLRAAVDDRDLGGRVRFHPKVPYDDLPGVTASADFGVTLLEDLNLSTRLAAPNKLFEYLHAGIPVLASDRTEARRVLSRYDVGVAVGPGEGDVAAGIEALLQSKRTDEWRRTAREAAKEYCWSTEADTFFQTLLI
jgi:glycosyltransferase involved in cell wall biosynthesis